MPIANDTLIDSLVAPAFILSATGQLLSANQSGFAMLREGSLLRVREGVFLLSSAVAHASLTLQLQQMQNGANIASKPVIIPGLAGSTSVMRLHPFLESRAAGATEFGDQDGLRILAVIVDLDHTPMPSAELLREVYRLTEAESAISLAIANGMTLQEFAKARKVSTLTVRNQLRHASDKMGARRQSEVVSKVLRLGLAASGL
jgi:DNA-binding CsgD family transcriptional regulator